MAVVCRGNNIVYARTTQQLTLKVYSACRYCGWYYPPRLPCKTFYLRIVQCVQLFVQCTSLCCAVVLCALPVQLLCISAVHECSAVDPVCQCYAQVARSGTKYSHDSMGFPRHRMCACMHDERIPSSVDGVEDLFQL